MLAFYTSLPDDPYGVKDRNIEPKRNDKILIIDPESYQEGSPVRDSKGWRNGDTLLFCLETGGGPGFA